MKLHDSKLIVIACMVSLAACVAPPTINSISPRTQRPAVAAYIDAYGPVWPAAHTDAANTDFAPVDGPRDITLAWSRRFDGTINLGATSDGEGRVFVTTSGEGCHLHALYYRTGETLWCSEDVNHMAVASSALVDRDGHLFVADNEAMHAFTEEGQFLWEHPIEGVPLSAQFTPQGRLLFITHIGRLYVLDRRTGTPMLDMINLAPELEYRKDDDARACMRGTEECPAANTLAIDAQGRFFFTFWAPGDTQAGLRAMRYQENPTPRVEPLWTNNALPGGSASSPDISSDGTRLYVNDNDGGLHAIDVATSRILWTYDIGYETGGSQSTSPDGLLMPAGGGTAPLMALRDRGDHPELLWRHENMLNRGVATQARGGVAYPTVSSGQRSNDILVIDTATGLELDREPLPGRTSFTVGTTLDINGYVYVPTFFGQLFAFRPADGE